MDISILFLVAAFILFVIAAIGVDSGRFNLIAAGLACWLAATIIPLVH